MKRIVLVCLSAIAVVTHVAPLLTRAQVPTAADATATAAQAAEPLVTLSFDETPLADVVKAFREATGANIISSGTNLQGSVSVSLNNVPWRKGLTSILDPHSLQLVEQPTGSGIFVVTAKSEMVPKVTKTFELKYARSEEVTNLLGRAFGNECTAVAYTAGNVVIVTATEKQITESASIIESIDKPAPQVYIEVRFAELSATASKQLGLKWDNLGGEGWGLRFDGAKLGYNDTSSRDSNRGRTSGSSASFTDEAVSTTASSRNLANDLNDSFENDLRNIIGIGSSSSSSGNGFNRNSTSLDSQNATRSYSNNKLSNQERIFTGSLSMDAFALTLNAFEKTGGISIFSNPKIIVANEKEALIDMTTKEPNLSVTTTRSGSQSDQLDISARLELIPGNLGDKDGKDKGLFAGEAFFSYGISVKVTPRISPTGLITLVIEPSISALNSATPYYVFTGVDANTPTPRFPIIDMQRMQTVFTMQSDTTAVIGGLTRTTEGSIDSGIPLLRKLPWVGPRVFGWKSRQKEQKEIIIFVTVGIADPVALPESIGMPKNAILGRDLLTGATKEPGDRTKEEVMSLEDPKPPRKNSNKKPKALTPDTPAAPDQKDPPAQGTASVSEAEAAKPTEPARLEPLLQNKE